MTTPNAINPKGYCLCGCGRKTLPHNRTCADKGWIYGQPRDFVFGHYVRVHQKARPEDQLRCRTPFTPEGRLRLAESRVTTALLYAERYPHDLSYALALTARRNERDAIAEAMARRQSA